MRPLICWRSGKIAPFSPFVPEHGNGRCILYLGRDVDPGRLLLRSGVVGHALGGDPPYQRGRRLLPPYAARLVAARRCSVCLNLFAPAKSVPAPSLRTTNDDALSWEKKCRCCCGGSVPEVHRVYRHLASGKLISGIKFHFFSIKWQFPVLGPSLRDLISPCCHGRHEKASTP